MPDPATDHPGGEPGSGPDRIPPRLGETILAVGVALFGLLVVWQTTQIRVSPAYTKVGPRVIPYIVGIGLVLLGAWLLAEVLTGRGLEIPPADSEDADASLPTDWRTVGFLAAALLAYLLLIERAGFVLASAVLFAGASAAMGSRRTVRDIAGGLLLSALLYVGFTRGLGLDLPAGPLGGVL